MPPIATAAPPATAHAIHAAAHVRADKSADRRAAKESRKATRTKISYRVRRGDNLTTIAAAHQVTLAALLKANELADPHRLLVGQRITVPTRSATHPTKHTAKHRSGGTSSHQKAKAKRTSASSKKSSKKSTAAQRSAARYDGLSHRQVLAKGRAATKAVLAARAVPGKGQTKELIKSTARKYGVSTELALGITWQESGWNQRSVSSVNAVGVMQVMPQSGVWASALAGRELNLLDTRDNITAGVVILRYLTSNASNLDQAIGSYYQGLGAMRAHGPYRDTSAYIGNVRAHMERL